MQRLHPFCTIWLGGGENSLSYTRHEIILKLTDAVWRPGTVRRWEAVQSWVQYDVRLSIALSRILLNPLMSLNGHEL